MSSNEEYEPTDSEDNYSEEEKELLVNVRKGRKHVENGKKEILAFADDSSDDDDADDLMNDSDIEGADDDGDMLDPMNWGDKKRNYYNTDFIDKDFSSYNAEEEEFAKAEEEEAKIIQSRLAKQLNEADFSLDTFKPVGVAKEDNTESSIETQSIHVATDLSGLLQRERLQLFFKDSPEFNGLTRDFKKFLDEVNALIWPVYEYINKHKMPIIPALKFADIYKNILMTYCSNVALYLLLKAKRIGIKNHPVVKRLVQLKQLLEQLRDKYDNIIEPQLKALLQRIEDGDKFVIKLPAATDKHKMKQCKLKMEKHDDKRITNMEDSSSDDDDDDENMRDAEDIGETEALEENGELRRGITYQIAKNKGLIPHRKKEQRNPRVKHRGKYRKALIRRKGAVRTVSSKVQRYGGEVSGIKATVSKSIKFK